MLKGYVTNLGKYNEGYLVGEWVTFPVSEEELEAVFERIGINEEYEEYFITDYENDYDIKFNFGEYTSIEHINEVIEGLEVMSDYELDMFKAVVEYEGLSSVLDEGFNPDHYSFYQNMTLEDVAYELIDECYDLPEFARRYFDYEAFARDLSFDGYYEASTGVLVTY